MSNYPTGKELVDIADEHLDKSLDRHEKGLELIWRGQNEMNKTLITLSSGALIFSISVIQFLGKSVAKLFWLWTLPTSWILFCISILMGVLILGYTSVARSTRYNMDKQRGDIRYKLWELDGDDPEFPEKFDNILEDAFQKAQNKSQKAIKIIDRLSYVMFTAFTLGIIFLATFAIVNIPN